MSPLLAQSGHAIPSFACLLLGGKRTLGSHPVKVGSKWRLCRALNQDPQQFIGVCFNGLTNLDEFDDVDTPFAAFVFGDKRLRSMKALGELVLCQAGSLARRDHQIAKGSLSYGMDRFVEFSRTCSHRRGRLIRSSDYPKRGYILTLLLYCLPFQWTSALREANCRHGQFGRQSDGANK
jgi:hypothetical protein